MGTVVFMAFTIDIANTTASPDKYNKSNDTTIIQQGVSISPLSTINQLTPVFVVDYDSRYLNANYIIATFLGRKYFATVSVDTAGRMIIQCKVDYISSFNLSNCPITVTRNGGIGRPTEIPDNKLPIIPNRKKIDSITVFSPDINTTFINDTRSLNYVVTVVGGESV